MNDIKEIKSALISVYYKDNLEPLIKKLNELGVKLYSTGGTQKFIEDLGIKVTAVEDITGYPSILGGRVKTLHPMVFGGILGRRDNPKDVEEMKEYKMEGIDMVIVNLYPFEETVASGASHEEIIEKIDIGGISLIRAAAKNYKDVLVVSTPDQYEEVCLLLDKDACVTSETRKRFAMEAFNVTSGYDTSIFNYFISIDEEIETVDDDYIKTLRYGENPHQKAEFIGNINEYFTQLHGKELSYNNLLDIDSALSLISDFEETTVAVIKHNNACGLASRDSLCDAWKAALAGDPVSAYGGVIVTNRKIDVETAEEINKIFFEVLIAPGYDEKVLEILKQKKNRVILEKHDFTYPQYQFRSVMNGMLKQERDVKTETYEDLKVITKENPTDREKEDLLFANKIVKHTKSNAIVLAKNKQLFGSGTGQTSRVDALKHGIEKANQFGFDLNGAVMASDAFFPFPDCVEIAYKVGIHSIIQPGGSKNDNLSIEFCDNNGLSMVMTGFRHFKH
ncbi:MAG: bifunctional phosphoribosylaminoimidazolecarboxamide formyltransferase/IMP cyclohydrolase [Bacteroidota bacterium]|nr:bifunctional phosphoribosylaminoimidazolecarboxamide formyltransferase/IMP cyclohydrolase [Bacteroidota bacterium]